MLKRLPTTKELYAFLVTGQKLSFTHAAELLNLSQGAVSRQVISLEKYLGVELFYRHARGLHLTPAGMKFLPQVEQALGQLGNAIESLSTENGKLRIKAPTCILPWLLPRLISFRSTHPEIEVELTSTAGHGVNFSTENFQAAIVYGQQQDPQLSYRELFEEILTPMCIPALPGVERLVESPTYLQDLTWLHASESQRDWKLWLEHAGLGDLQAGQNQHFDTLDMATNAAQRGFGITIGDVTLSAEELASGRLIAPFEARVTSGFHYFLVYPNQMVVDPRLVKFGDWLVM
ncbi:transcriptional regulator [Hahella sp. CCB-MM4]|uniref:LysR substrate-binding domain-containing protein n=1 Tax=Hahella sp. (strain CCB-MM4) TaxID=1926491 RepID=UPI000B9BDCB4|nr:LysR substrate-binding domain-containing protein [Hahella sp. CCB-MM4]OZG69977.1 transcriptional regulator [Hahella sp. CCB-MM4]